MILEYMLGGYGGIEPITQNYDENSIATNFGLPFDLLENTLNQLEDALDEQVLTETFMEEFSDSMRDIGIALTKGRKAMIKRAEEAAQQANNYKQEIEAYLSTIDKTVRKTIFVLVETYTITISNGNTTITYTETRTPKFSGVIVDADKYIKMIDNGVNHKAIKKQVRSVVNKAVDQARFKVGISVGKAQKMSVEQAMKEISESIARNKKVVSDWSAVTNNMLKWINELKTTLGDMKRGNENDVKFKISILKKMIYAQRLFYNHDSDMVYQGSRLVIRKSRAIKDAIKKYAKVKV